jgi:hypothetical protein
MYIAIHNHLNDAFERAGMSMFPYLLLCSALFIHNALGRIPIHKTPYTPTSRQQTTLVLLLGTFLRYTSHRCTFSRHTSFSSYHHTPTAPSILPATHHMPIALAVSASTTLCAAAKNSNLISCCSGPPAFCYLSPGDVTDLRFIQWTRESFAECHHCLQLTLTGVVTGVMYAHVDLEERDEKEGLETVLNMEIEEGVARRCVGGKWHDFMVTRNAHKTFRTKLNHHMWHAIKFEQGGSTERRDRLPLAVDVNVDGPEDEQKCLPQVRRP